MSSGKISYKPIKGKTFTLFDHSDGSDQYFLTIQSLADICLKEFESETDLLNTIQDLGRKRNLLKIRYLAKNNGDIKSHIVKLLYTELHPFTTEVNEHLRKLSVFKAFDHTLNTNEFQYHLQMLEVELVNRINIDEFSKANRKFALLPHCLRDFTKQCKSEMGDLDYVCKECNKDCFVRHATVSLKKYNVTPYIWMNMNLKKLALKLKSQKENFGVLGIACFPELVNGIRLCSKSGIPVVGIPLNANRCARWTGRFLENSVNITELEKLLGSGQNI
jgi:hypothetical protein